jgi:hypothetical protein
MQELQEPENVGCRDDYRRVDPTEPRDAIQHTAWVRQVLDDRSGQDHFEASINREILEPRDVTAPVPDAPVVVFRKPALHL